MNFSGLVHHLVHGEGDEISEHDVHDRAQSGHGSAYANSREARLGDGRVEHALGSKFLNQSR
jgi:hypothetical protein